MSYYCGFDLEKEHFCLYDDSSHLAYIGASKIKNEYIEISFKRFKNKSSSCFEINKNIFNQLMNLDQFKVIDMIKEKNMEFIYKYDIGEWLI